MNLSQVCTQERPLLVLKARTAADLMTSNPVSLRETATVREAARFLTERGISAAPVINGAGAPVGVLSQTDLVVHDREKGDALWDGEGRVEDFAEFAEVPGEPRAVWGELRLERVDDKARVRDLMTPTVFTVRSTRRRPRSSRTCWGCGSTGCSSWTAAACWSASSRPPTCCAAWRPRGTTTADRRPPPGPPPAPGEGRAGVGGFTPFSEAV